MTYKYSGPLTVDVEDSHERQIELLRMAEQRSWDAAEEARQEARRIARQNEALRNQMAELRRQKKNAQTQARRLRTKIATVPKPEPIISLPTVFGGRQGLLAAAAEVARFEARRRQERKAA
jgi:hypothetical protein